MSDGYDPNAPAFDHALDDHFYSIGSPAASAAPSFSSIEQKHGPLEDDVPAPVIGAAPRTFAGLPLPTVILGALVLLMGLWSLWLTRELLVLRSHKTVSVSLATIVHDFIAVEAHNGGTPETSAVRTKLYLAATQSAIRSLADQGQTVLVSEAVAGNSVPDVTPQLKASIDSKLRAMQIAAATAGAVDGH